MATRREYKKNKKKTPRITMTTEDKIKCLVRVLRDGKLAVIPTDTVYGIVARALDENAVENLYNAKGRKPEKPFIIVISSLDQLSSFGVNLSVSDRKIINKLWPGPHTLIFDCDKNLEYLHRGTEKLAFRLPQNDFLINLVELTGPLVAPSANPEGFSISRDIEEATSYFKEKVDCYFNGGILEGEPSTIIDCSNNPPVVLRGNDQILSKLLN